MDGDCLKLGFQVRGEEPIERRGEREDFIGWELGTMNSCERERENG